MSSQEELKATPRFNETGASKEKQPSMQEKALENLKSQAIGLKGHSLAANIEYAPRGTWNRNNDEVVFIDDKGESYILPNHPGLNKLLEDSGLARRESLAVPHIGEWISQQRLNRGEEKMFSNETSVEKTWMKLQEDANREKRNYEVVEQQKKTKKEDENSKIETLRKGIRKSQPGS
jgi:hypothetical protein